MLGREFLAHHVKYERSGLGFGGNWNVETEAGSSCCASAARADTVKIAAGPIFVSLLLKLTRRGIETRFPATVRQRCDCQ